MPSKIVCCITPGAGSEGWKNDTGKDLSRKFGGGFSSADKYPVPDK